MTPALTLDYHGKCRIGTDRTFSCDTRRFRPCRVFGSIVHSHTHYTFRNSAHRHGFEWIAPLSRLLEPKAVAIGPGKGFRTL